MLYINNKSNKGDKSTQDSKSENHGTDQPVLITVHGNEFSEWDLVINPDILS